MPCCGSAKLSKAEMLDKVQLLNGFIDKNNESRIQMFIAEELPDGFFKALHKEGVKEMHVELFQWLEVDHIDQLKEKLNQLSVKQRKALKNRERALHKVLHEVWDLNKIKCYEHEVRKCIASLPGFFKTLHKDAVVEMDVELFQWLELEEILALRRYSKYLRSEKRTALKERKQELNTQCLADNEPTLVESDSEDGGLARPGANKTDSAQSRPDLTQYLIKGVDGAHFSDTDTENSSTQAEEKSQSKPEMRPGLTQMCSRSMARVGSWSQTEQSNSTLDDQTPKPVQMEEMSSSQFANINPSRTVDGNLQKPEWYPQASGCSYQVPPMEGTTPTDVNGSPISALSEINKKDEPPTKVSTETGDKGKPMPIPHIKVGENTNDRTEHKSPSGGTDDENPGNDSLHRQLAHLDEYQHSNPVPLALFLMIIFIVGMVWLRFTRSSAEPKKRCRKATANDAKLRNSSELSC